MPRPEIAVRSDGVVRTYRTRSSEVRALRGITSEFVRGSVNALVGPSGSGKSTLLRLLGTLDLPNAGLIEAGGLSVSSLGPRRRRRFRRDAVWFVFQQPSDNFFPRLTLAEQLPTANPEAWRILERLGITERMRHRPEALSGGEQQRAAFTQAVAAGADLVLADEPTAELDNDSARAVISVMKDLADRGVTVVVATHDPAVVAAADHVTALDHGRVIQDRLPARGARGESREASPRRVWTDRGLSRGSPRSVLSPSHLDEPAGVEGIPISGPKAGDRPRSDFLLTAHDLHKWYERGQETVHAVEGVSFSLLPSEFVGIMGRSGSGKTTLLNLLAGWERPNQGAIVWSGFELDADDDHLQALPWLTVAVVPQHLGLMDELTVRENVELPRRLGGGQNGDGQHVDELLERLQLTQLAARYPSETSVGEQQRAALARALAVMPRLVLADEPTGHQDEKSAQLVFETFAWASENGTCCVVATHDSWIVPFLHRKLSMKDGRLVSAGEAPAER